MGKRKRNKGYGNDIASEQPPYKKPYVASDLPTGVHHYQTLSEVPWDLQKYWRQAYSMFSRYDDGIWMTDQAWYEVTHESIAHKIAEHISNTAPEDKSIIIDPFCGVGGNSIAFALSGRWQRVYAIEKDEATLACAKHNAEIYGVADQITWFCGDCFEVLGLKEPSESGTDDGLWQLKAVMGAYGVIFASPPWGGPGYKDDKVFDVETMQPYNLSYLYEKLAKVTPHMVLYLPRTSDMTQIAEKIEGDEKAQAVHYCQNGASRAMCVYYGDWKMIES